MRLLLRTTRKLTLTEAGRRYLESVDASWAKWRRRRRRPRPSGSRLAGTLRVNAPLSFGVREIAPLMAEFARQHPAVVVDLGLSDRFVDLVEEGWDLAVRIGRMQDSSMIARRLAPCRMVVCGSPDYLTAHGRPTTVKELAGHNCLSYTLSRTQIRRSLAVRSGRRGSACPSRATSAPSNGDALVAAALAGQGLIYEPTFLLSDALKDGRLVASSSTSLHRAARHLRRPPGEPPAAGQGTGVRRVPGAALRWRSAVGSLFIVRFRIITERERVNVPFIPFETTVSAAERKSLTEAAGGMSG